MSSTQATILKYEDVFKKKVESENIQNIQLSELHDYSNHPFKVQDDEAMEELVQSIRDKGVLEPIDVRPMDQGGYEILSGHRRVHACRKLGLLTIPCMIRRLDDEEAADLMVYSNYSKPEMVIAGDSFPTELVRERFQRLQEDHIEYVLECMNASVVRVRNMKKYLLAALLNATSTIGSYYSMLVRSDMAGASSD